MQTNIHELTIQCLDCVPQDFTPVRIENSVNSTSASAGNSVWNSAGTWYVTGLAFGCCMSCP